MKSQLNLNRSELSLLELIAVEGPELLTGLDPNFVLHNYELLARPKQKFPTGNWLTWLIKSGRGFGKTFVGANWVIHKAKTQKYPIAIIGKNSADVRDVQVEVNESSILKQSPSWFMPEYQPSKRRLVWPNGVIGILYSAEDPDLLRGPQHGSVWADEFAKYQYPKELWDNVLFGLRLGDNPQAVITTTPRPIKTLIEIAKDPNTVITTGSTFENRSNLSSIALEELYKKYNGTRLGRQELYGEILTDVPGALWTYTNLDKYRITKSPELKEIIIAIDPAMTANETSNETGIVVCGIDDNSHGYLLEDVSGIYQPVDWARKVESLYTKYQANRIVAEVNQGGDLVKSNLDMYCKSQGKPLLPFTSVRATRSKYIRAEPIATLYEQGRVHHVGTFAELEDQLCNWLPGDNSPDRLDATVWGFTYLLVKENIITTGQSLW